MARSAKSIKRVGFVIKHHQPEAANLAIELAEFLLGGGASVVFCTESAEVSRTLVRTLKRAAEPPKNLTARVKTVPKPKLIDHTDLIVVLGGDGTFLSIARLMREHSVPIMGVNMGQLGFLTEIKRDEAMEILAQIMAGRIPPISNRALLEVTLKRKEKVIFRGPVVNDAVVSKGAIARIIGMSIAVDGKWVHDVRADGIIVSTPTGSTAYSLAAGGPIITPALGALCLSPICPHSLTQRPLVLPDTSEIQIRLNLRPGQVTLTLDGQDAIEMKDDDIVTVRRFKKHSLKLISAPGRDYFSVLREKLKFGMRD